MSLATAEIDCTVSPPLLGAMEDCSSKVGYESQNRSCSASSSAYSYTFLRSVVCLSVVCHIRAPCLNHSTDLDAIGRYTCRCHWHIVLDGGLHPPSGEGDIWGQIRRQNMHLQPSCQSYAATWRIQTNLLLPPSERCIHHI